MSSEKISLLNDSVLQLEAEVSALRLLLGVVVAESPAVIESLQKLDKHYRDLAVSFPRSDAQNAVAAEVLSQVLSAAISYRATAYSPEQD